MKLTEAEKKLVRLYRKADEDARNKALAALGDEDQTSDSGSGILGNLLGGDGGSGVVGSLLGLLTGKRSMEDGGTEENE